MKFSFVLLLFLCATSTYSQQEKVNVFLGSSGDHGQISPAASSPFHQLSILPYTNPSTHTGYELLAKEIKGFTHNRLEGVGCVGSGGLILIKPYLNEFDARDVLHKKNETASPGRYRIESEEGIHADFVVTEDFGRERYTFPTGKKGLFIDLEHSFNRAFVDNEMQRVGNMLVGKVRAKTTCHAGTYTIYYAIEIAKAKDWKIDGNKIQVGLPEHDTEIVVNIAFSAISTEYAVQKISEGKTNSQKALSLQDKSADEWNNYLGKIKVEGDADLEKMFYSLLYRTVQSPFRISEKDGKYRATDGNLYQTSGQRYHGWAIWDNYKTQLPLLELMDSGLYQDIVLSISDLYRYGKYDFAGPFEPANSVRTEHAAVVLLDAQRKGYDIQLDQIRDSLVRDTARFDFSKPDKYLEACYDMWAMGHLLQENKTHYHDRAGSYQYIWEKDFKDLSRSDVDRMSARNMYQGTIRQYRWNVPFDVKGLIGLAGGQQEFTKQLDDFYDNYYFNRANEPDMQSFTLYYASNTPWRYQEWVHRLALDTVVQYYFNDNSRGIGAHIDRVYKNEPKAFIRTMDDDAGAMSSWWVLSSIGLHQPLIGEPIYYLSVPFFDKITLENNGKPLVIRKKGDKNGRYIKSIQWNGKDLGRIWITREELGKGGNLLIETSSNPTDYGIGDMWISGAKG